MKRRGRNQKKTDLSIHAQRMLRDWEVEKKLKEHPEEPVTLEPDYRLKTGEIARISFRRDAEGRICVGYALERGGDWVVDDDEPFSLRSLGYYQRRLKRHGRRVWPDDEDEEEEAAEGGPRRGRAKR